LTGRSLCTWVTLYYLYFAGCLALFVATLIAFLVNYLVMWVSIFAFFNSELFLLRAKTLYSFLPLAANCVARQLSCRK
jgi:hypothetical protein